jgi:hypothetical protein
LGRPRGFWGLGWSGAGRAFRARGGRDIAARKSAATAGAASVRTSLSALRWRMRTSAKRSSSRKRSFHSGTRPACGSRSSRCFCTASARNEQKTWPRMVASLLPRPLGISIVALLRLDVRLDIFRRHQPDVVAVAGEDTAEVMGAAARLYLDNAGRQLLRQPDQRLASHLAPHHSRTRRGQPRCRRSCRDQRQEQRSSP